MFSSGDCAYWLMVEKEELIGDDGYKYYGGEKRKILRSSQSTRNTMALWYRRENNLEDPWVSISAHPSFVVYGENAVSSHSSIPYVYDGADVFIRQSMLNTIK